jgi:hypothetical protein
MNVYKLEAATKAFSELVGFQTEQTMPMGSSPQHRFEVALIAGVGSNPPDRNWKIEIQRPIQPSGFQGKPYRMSLDDADVELVMSIARERDLKIRIEKGKLVIRSV